MALKPLGQGASLVWFTRPLGSGSSALRCPRLPVRTSAGAPRSARIAPACRPTGKRGRPSKGLAIWESAPHGGSFPYPTGRSCYESRAARGARRAPAQGAPGSRREVAEQRVVIEEMMASTPLADDVTTSDATLGGIEAILVETSGTSSDRLFLYLHGGAYALGSAEAGVGLASEVARRARARAYSIDYRLAPPSGDRLLCGKFRRGPARCGSG